MGVMLRGEIRDWRPSPRDITRQCQIAVGGVRVGNVTDTRVVRAPIERLVTTCCWQEAKAGAINQQRATTVNHA